mgnify:CR=1 FL=1
MFYTYAHYKPEGGLFYIGKGKRRRAFQMDNRNSHWNNIVNKYGKPHVELLASWDTEEEALDHERLGHAILDVFDTEPLPQTDAYWSHPKVTVTPHTSFAGSGTMSRWTDLFLDNLKRFSRDQPLHNRVDPASFTD